MIQVEVKINGVLTLVDIRKLEKLDSGLLADNYREDFTVDTDKELEIESANNIAEARDKAMFDGAVYTIGSADYLISFTKDDGDGLTQVKSAFEVGLETTTIHFENGTKLPITREEFLPFALWFVNKRNEFFL